MEIDLKKKQRCKMKKIICNEKNALLCVGSFGLKVLEACLITPIQIEAARRVLVQTLKKEGKVWVRVKPNYVITKKPKESRMGKGKGLPDGVVYRLKAGSILFEIEGVSHVVAKEAIQKAGFKLPVLTLFIGL